MNTTRHPHASCHPRFRGDDKLVWVSAMALTASTPVHAAGPENWQVGFGERGSSIARLIADLHDRVILIGAVIILIVLGLLVFVAWRYGLDELAAYWRHLTTTLEGLGR